MTKSNLKSILLITLVLFVSTQSLAQSGNIDSFLTETVFELSIKSKCKASVFSYRCKGGVKFDETKVTQWKKDPFKVNSYEYVGLAEPDLFKVHEQKRIEFLKKTCLSDAFVLHDMREIFTCAENKTKHQIIFSLKIPSVKPMGHNEYNSELVCDDKGAEEWKKIIWPLAEWKELAKTPHYYEANPGSKEKLRELENKIYATFKNMPKGCRHINCALNEPIPDACEKEKPE